MEINKIQPSTILDADQVDEIIHFYAGTYIQNLVFYNKTRYLKSDFNGSILPDEDNYIRTRSLWYADLINGTTKEIVPFGKYDINDFHIAHNYVYFIKITDKDGDGHLDDDYSNGGEIWRVNRFNNIVEFCFDCKDKFDHFSFETANDDIVVYRTEDEVTELIFIDLTNNRIAYLESSWEKDDNSFDFRFVEDENKNPTHILTKKWVSEAEQSSPSHTLNSITWSNLMTQLVWKPI